MTIRNKNEYLHFDYAYESFFYKIEKYAELNDLKKNFLREFLRISFYPPKSYYAKEGQKTKLLGFMVKGSAINLNESDNKNVINRFYLEDSFICSIHSFLTQTESDSDIQFFESSVVLEFDYLAYLNIKKNFPEINNIIYGLQNEEILFYKKRLRSMQIGKAKDRLEELLSENHNFLSRFRNRDIATYLGIENETLSRLNPLANKHKR